MLLLSDLSLLATFYFADESLGRRVAAAVHSAQRRPPLSASRQSDVLSHSHIRIVPHVDIDSAYRDEEEPVDKTPTFRSPSVQFGSSSEHPAHSTKDSRSDLVGSRRTFADMARRFHQSDDKVESEQFTPASVPPVGVVKLQPNRRNMTGPWRRMQASEPSESGSRDGDSKHNSYSIDGPHSSGTTTITSSEPPPVQFRVPSRASALIENQNPSIIKNIAIFRTSPEASRAQRNGNTSVGIHLSEGDHYEHLFGKLPDPIRLHEQTGQFDGQVMFIAHPSRDISAHQWSSASFQWINIGRYAHHRGIVEGSLASDCSKEYRVSENPLEFFKCAAESREKLIKEHGRPIASPEAPKTSHGAVDSSKESLPKTTRGLNIILKEDYLEDPFVVASVGLASSNTSSLHPNTDKIEARGSMDFEYEFPFKSMTTSSPVLDYTTGLNAREFCFEVKKTSHEESYRNAILPNRMSQLALQDIAFEEDAASSPTTSDARGFLSSRTLMTSSPEEPRYRRLFRNDQVELRGGQAPIPRRADPIASSLFPPPGLTVANPHRVVSTLNASAPPYPNVQRPPPGYEISEPEVSNVHDTAAALRFSDPDGLRSMQEYEIANGLSKQPPTKQNFKGPFFTESKPSTSDPTVSLSVSINEEEKLLNWFRDGHRAARQQEYAKTLMSTAGQVNRNRRPGVIGDVETRRGKEYENTPTFIRLYECLSEYVEESRGTGERSYFTRAWKPAPPALRDQGPDGNNSFFTSPVTTAPGPYVSSSRMPWGDVGSPWNLRGCSPAEYRHRF